MEKFIKASKVICKPLKPRNLMLVYAVESMYVTGNIQGLIKGIAIGIICNFQCGRCK